MRFVPFLLALSLLISSGPARSATPAVGEVAPASVNWQVGKPLVFSQGQQHLSLGDTLEQVESQLGPWPEPSNDLVKFPGNVIVRLSEGKIVNLTLVGPPCPWVLKVNDVEACHTGELGPDLEKRLGPPRLRFSKPIPDNKTSLVWLYSAALGDAALVFVDTELRSVLLAEPDRLETILPTAGYTRLP